MNDVFRPFIDDFVIVYLDEILVFSRTWKDHVMHVKKVLDVLKRDKLCVNLSKCDFGNTSRVYLGYVVGDGQLKVDPSKVDSMFNWTKPSTVMEVRSFLREVRYWRKFISNFSYIEPPFHALTSVKHVFQLLQLHSVFFSC